MHVCVSVCVRVRVHKHSHTQTHIHTCMSVCVCVCVCMCVCTDVRVFCVCMDVCACTWRVRVCAYERGKNAWGKKAERLSMRREILRSACRTMVVLIPLSALPGISFHGVIAICLIDTQSVFILLCLQRRSQHIYLAI